MQQNPEEETKTPVKHIRQFSMSSSERGDDLSTVHLNTSYAGSGGKNCDVNHGS